LRRFAHAPEDTRVRLVRYYSRPYRQRVQERALGAGREAIVMEGVPAARVRSETARHERRGRTVVARADVLVVATRPELAHLLDERFGDPREAGRLLRYPACCVEAFVTSPFAGGDDFAHLRRGLRATRTRPRWMLNALVDDALVPFHPCRLDCPVALRFAAGVWRAQPEGTRAALRTRLATSVLRWSDLDVALVRRGRAFAFNRAGTDVAGRAAVARALTSGDLNALAPRRVVLLRWG
jgi:hypothetical protein